MEHGIKTKGIEYLQESQKGTTIGYDTLVREIDREIESRIEGWLDSMNIQQGSPTKKKDEYFEQKRIEVFRRMSLRSSSNFGINSKKNQLYEDKEDSIAFIDDDSMKLIGSVNSKNQIDFDASGNSLKFWGRVCNVDINQNKQIQEPLLSTFNAKSTSQLSRRGLANLEPLKMPGIDINIRKTQTASETKVKLRSDSPKSGTQSSSKKNKKVSKLVRKTLDTVSEFGLEFDKIDSNLICEKSIFQIEDDLMDNDLSVKVKDDIDDILTEKDGNFNTPPTQLNSTKRHN